MIRILTGLIFLMLLSPVAEAQSMDVQISNYRGCVETLVQNKLSWFDSFAVCAAGNSAGEATQCINDFNSHYPGWNQSVVAMACAGHSDAAKVYTCMEDLFNRNGSAYDPSITNSACSGRSQTAQAETCLKTLMPTYGNVLAGIVCGGGNNAAKASHCLVAFPQIDPVFLAEACSGANSVSWVSACMKAATVKLKNLAGTSGQEERAAGFACASAAPPMSLF